MSNTFKTGDKVAYFDTFGEFVSWTRVHKIYKNGNIAVKFDSYGGGNHYKQFKAAGDSAFETGQVYGWRRAKNSRRHSRNA